MNPGTTQLQAQPMVLVPQAVWDELERFRRETSEQLALLTNHAVTNGSEWLTRQQAMAFLQVGDTKLWQIKGELETSGGARPLYKVSSCRTYLERNGYSPEQIDRQFRELLSKKSKKK